MKHLLAVEVEVSSDEITCRHRGHFDSLMLFVDEHATGGFVLYGSRATRP
jgi:hypothetical protein